MATLTSEDVQTILIKIGMMHDICILGENDTYLVDEVIIAKMDEIRWIILDRRKKEEII